MLMRMHSASVAFVFLFLAWSSAALPCNNDWSAQRYSGVTYPEEVILLTISEASDESEALESAGEGHISADEPDLSDHHISGEVVESADNDELTQKVVLESDPLSSSQSENHEESGCDESVDGDVVPTEEPVKTDN